MGATFAHELRLFVGSSFGLLPPRTAARGINSNFRESHHLLCGNGRVIPVTVSQMYQSSNAQSFVTISVRDENDNNKKTTTTFVKTDLVYYASQRRCLSLLSYAYIVRYVTAA
jgi:hypothetical protein